MTRNAGLPRSLLRVTLGPSMPTKNGLVERTYSVDVVALHRKGAFSGRPMWFPFQGLETNRYKIEYRDRDWPKDRPTQIIPVRWTRCHFGGTRPWLICLCGQRVAKLYPGLGHYMCCRKCMNLAYQSQRRSRKGRLYRKAEEIRNRLWDSGLPGIDAFPKRPFRMHKKTFARHLALLATIERKLTDPAILRRNRPYQKSF